VGELADVEQLDEQLRVVDVAVDGVYASCHQVRLLRPLCCLIQDALLLTGSSGGRSWRHGDQHDLPVSAQGVSIDSRRGSRLSRALQGYRVVVVEVVEAQHACTATRQCWNPVIDRSADSAAPQGYGSRTCIRYELASQCHAATQQVRLGNGTRPWCTWHGVLRYETCVADCHEHCMFERTLRSRLQ